MKTGSGRAKVARLIQIVLAMQGGRCPSVDDLARHCEVSRRTIFRDLESLEDAGVAFVYDADRQGYRFDLSMSIDPPRLEEQELRALVVLVEQWGKVDGACFLRHARTAVSKVVQRAPSPIRGRLVALGDSVRGAGWPVERARDRAELYGTLVESFTRRIQVRCWFREGESLQSHCTKLSPYRLLLGRTHWSVVGRSSWHRRVQVMPVPLIERLELTPEAFDLPPRLSLDRFGVEGDGPPRTVRLRFQPEAAPWVRDAVWHPSQKVRPRPDGGLDFEAAVSRTDEILGWILGFGDRVEVLGPADLRARLHQIGKHLLNRYPSAPGNGVAKQAPGALAFGADGDAHAPD